MPRKRARSTTERSWRPRMMVRPSCSMATSKRTLRRSTAVTVATAQIRSPGKAGATWSISSRVPTEASPRSKAERMTRWLACSRKPTRAGVATTATPVLPIAAAV